MDFSKVILKFNQVNSNHIKAYCDAYPSVIGQGKNQEAAVADFWKNFNNADSNESKVISLEKKRQQKAQELEKQSKQDKHKKSA